MRIRIPRLFVSEDGPNAKNVVGRPEGVTRCIKCGHPVPLDPYGGHTNLADDPSLAQLIVASSASSPGDRALGQVRAATSAHRDTPFHEGAARYNLFAIKGHLKTRAVSKLSRLQRPRSEVLLVLVWGAAALHVREEVLRRAEGTLVRMAKICLHVSRAESQRWVDWQVRSWRMARSHLTTSRGIPPVAVVATRAVLGMCRLASRPACLVVYRSLR